MKLEREQSVRKRGLFITVVSPYSRTAIRRKAVALLVIVACTPVFGQSYSDIERLLEERNFGKVESLLQLRIAANTRDDSAHFYLAQIPVRARDEQKYDLAIDLLKKCIAMKPNSSAYHHWLGRAYGIKARDAGIFTALGYVGDVKASLQKAIDLDPRNSAARYDLITFYLRAPGIVGGSVSKAQDIARQHEAYDPNEAGLFHAQIQIYEKDYDDAEATLARAAKPADKEMLRHYRGLLTSLGYRWLSEDEPQRAQKMFQRCITEFPDAVSGYNGLGRSLVEQTKLDEAIPQFEKALALSKESGAQYRLALIYEQKGEKEKAIRYLNEFLDLRKGPSDRFVEEAREKLDQLKR